MTKLTDEKIKKMIEEKADGMKTNKEIADTYGIGIRRIQQLNKIYKETGEIPCLCKSRRPKRELTENEKEIIDEAYNDVFLGATLLRHYIRVHYNASIPQNKIHEYLLSKRHAKEDPKKKAKRKRCRYERTHSLSLVHADWFGWDGNKVIIYEDDASRRMLGVEEFSNATGPNTIKVLNETEAEVASWNGYILVANTDRGSQLYANKKGKDGKGKSKFQLHLESKGIKHIPSKRNNPQTNGKLERLIQEYKKHRHRFKDAKEFMDWYNNRPHGALDLENAETPNDAFIRKLRPEVLLGLFIKNFGGDLYG